MPRDERFILRSSGDAVAFISNGNIFDWNRRWIGFLSATNNVYDKSGRFVGVLLPDSRVVFDSTIDIPSAMPPPATPDTPLLPRGIPRSEPLPPLPREYAEVFLIGDVGGDRRLKYPILKWLTLMAFLAPSVMAIVALRNDISGRPPSERLIGAALFLAFLFASIAFTAGLKRIGGHRPRVLLIGSKESDFSIGESGATANLEDRNIVAFRTMAGEQLSSSRATEGGAEESLFDYVRRLRISEIVLAPGVTNAQGSAISDELNKCAKFGITVHSFDEYLERTNGEIRLESLRTGDDLLSSGYRQDVVRNFTKRSFDLLLCVVLLALSWPIMVVTALTVFLIGNGTVIARQQRVGLGGHIFSIFKFNTAYRDSALGEPLPSWSQSRDPRIGRVGRFLRATRIDELPQLFNVLRGDMSFVGPRPERRTFVEEISQEIPFYQVRHSVKPGLTGWAQVRYSYGASFEDLRRRLQFDLYYVKNHSLLLDTLILFETVRVVILGGEFEV